MPIRNIPEEGFPLQYDNQFRVVPPGAGVLRANQVYNHMVIEDVFEAEFDDDDDDEVEIMDAFNRDELNEEALKNELKKRHLSRDERHMLHKPKNDWVETPAGEVLRSAETLVVSDIIHKHLKK